MIKMRNLILLLLLTTGFIKAQENSTIEAKYYFKFVQDTLNSNSSTLETEMILLANSSRSVYFNEVHKKFVENIGNQVNATKNSGAVEVDLRNLSLPKVRHSAYRVNKQVFVTMPIQINEFTYEEPKLIWKIGVEKKKVAGYMCKNATTIINGKTFYVWYTEEIPIPDGPFKFKGLPGLIVYVSDLNKYIEFSLIKLITSEKPIIYNKATFVTKDQFLKKRNEILIDPTMGNIKDPAIRKDVESSINKINNLLD